MDTKLKTYKMLKTVPGVKAGDIQPTNFVEGETYEIDADLANQFYNDGAIEEVSGKAKNPAESRETKVTAPAESKGEEGEAGIDPETQRIEELNATARDHYGLETDTTMKPEDVREAIDAASDGDGAGSPESDGDPHATKRAKKAKK